MTVVIQLEKDGLEEGTISAFFQSGENVPQVLSRVMYIVDKVGEIFDLEFKVSEDLLSDLRKCKNSDLISLKVSSSYVYLNPYVKDGLFHFPKVWLSKYFEFEVKMAFIHNNEMLAKSIKLTKSNVKKLEKLKNDLPAMF